MPRQARQISDPLRQPASAQRDNAFNSTKSAQRLVSVHGAVDNMFNVQRHIGRAWPMERVCMQFPVACCKILYAACGLVAFSNAYAACKPEGPPLTPEMVGNFLDKPEILLGNDAGSKRAAYALSVSISQYAAADQATIRALKSILPSATLQQRVAIGEGLYTAVFFCRPIDPTIATRIESGVRLIGDKDVILAYRIAGNLSDPPSDISKPKTLSGFKSVKPSASAPALIGNPTPGSLDLKLRDPFGSPDAWR
jgi:hypothetical protein